MDFSSYSLKYFDGLLQIFSLKHENVPTESDKKTILLIIELKKLFFFNEKKFIG